MLSFNTINLDSMVHEIVREVKPEKIFLFGSHARGTARPDSDVDLLIVEKETFDSRSRRKELHRIRRSVSEFNIPKDILVFSEAEFMQWKNSLNHVIGHCSLEGILLYERS